MHGPPNTTSLFARGWVRLLAIVPFWLSLSVIQSDSDSLTVRGRIDNYSQLQCRACRPRSPARGQHGSGGVNSPAQFISFAGIMYNVMTLILYISAPKNCRLGGLIRLGFGFMIMISIMKGRKGPGPARCPRVG